VVLRRAGRVLLRGVVFAPHAAACVPGRLTSQLGVALGGRGHNLNCAAGGRRCAGRRRPGLVLGGRWRRRPLGWCSGCRCLLGGGVPCRLRGVAGVSPAGQTAMTYAGPARRGPPRPRPSGIPLPAGSGGRPARTAGRKNVSPLSDLAALSHLSLSNMWYSLRERNTRCATRYLRDSSTIEQDS
jgi:hypothetical protein